MERHSEAWSPDVIVTSDNSQDWPDGCQTEKVAEQLVDFFIIFNAGDQQRLPDYFGDEFKWFSATLEESGQERAHFVAYSRNDLFAYFAERHQQGEQWKLYTVRVNGLVDGAYVNIQYEMGRFADGLPEHLGMGKGALHCASQTIFVWSFSTHPREDDAPRRFDCPASTDEISEESVVVACSG